jgi:hypothetical protein
MSREQRIGIGDPRSRDPRRDRSRALGPFDRRNRRGRNVHSRPAAGSSAHRLNPGTAVGPGPIAREAATAREEEHTGENQR